MSENIESPGENLDEQDVETNDTSATTQDGDLVGDESGNEGDQPSEQELQEIERKKLSRFERLNQRHQAEKEDLQRENEFLKKLALEKTGSGSLATQLQTSVPGAPKIADFEGRSIDEYISARDKFNEDNIMERARNEALQTIAVERRKAELESHVKAARKSLPDWDEVMAEADEDPVIPMQDTVSFILEGGANGPFIAHYLAKNPDVHEELNKLSPMKRIAELGKLEDKLIGKGATSLITKKTSGAPTKLTSVKGNANVSSTDTAAAARQGHAAWKAADTARKEALTRAKKR